MPKNWCTIAPVKYRDPFHHLRVPFKFASGVTLDETPAWLRSPEFTDSLSFVHKDFISRSKYALFLVYSAKDIGSPDPHWKGKGSRSIQDAKHEALNLANLAIWLAKPCSFGFDVIFHTDQYPSPKTFRSLEQVRDLEAHQSYYKTYLHLPDLANARKLHGKILKVSRESAVWLGLYSLWNALREPLWATRYTLFWIALESLFGPDDGREITYRLSHRIGFFLGKNRKDAALIAQRVKKLYAWRSKTVHGMRLAKLEDHESLEVSYDTELFLRNALVKLLMSPRVMKEFLSDRERYLDSLVFN